MKEEDGGRESHYFLFVKGNQPKRQRAAFDAVQEQGPREPDYAELDRSHGRVSAGPSGSPTPAASTSRTSAGSRGSAATATAPTAS